MLTRHPWPRVVVVSYYMLRILADSIGKGDWKAVSFSDQRVANENTPYRLPETSKR